MLPIKESWKNGYFWTKTMGLPLWKSVHFFYFLKYLFLQLGKAFFCSRISEKTFSWPILPKKKGWNNGHIWTKPCVNPLGKMSIFRLFEIFVFIAQKTVFSFQNIVKDIFLAYIGYKEKLEKRPFFDQNHGLTPLEKCQFFDFLNFLFLYPRKGIFRSRIS